MGVNQEHREDELARKIIEDVVSERWLREMATRLEAHMKAKEPAAEKAQVVS